MKKIIAILFAAVLIFGLIMYYLLEYQTNKIEQLENQIEFLKQEIVPIKFKILENENSQIRFLVKFYDAEGNEINILEKKLHGKELFFDFYVIPVKNRYIAFPAKIFTDKMAPDHGIKLYTYYSEDGFPQIFYYPEINSDLKKGLEALFEDLQQENFDDIENYFGSAVHDIKEIRNFKPGRVYKIVVHTKGGIEIDEN